MSREQVKPLYSSSDSDSEVMQIKAGSPIYGIFSLVFGLFALVLCFVPLTTQALSIIGILLGVFGNKTSQYERMCRLGIALSGISLIISLVIMFATLSMMAGRMYPRV